jgi:mono/diheme cytochrome c family protein
MKKLFITCTLVTAFTVANSVYAESDVANGKKLYDANCHGCHDTRVHTRPNRIIHTYPDLVNRVKFCDAQTNSDFTDAQIEDVAAYLNKEFYKFIKD